MVQKISHSQLHYVPDSPTFFQQHLYNDVDIIIEIQVQEMTKICLISIEVIRKIAILL